MQGVPPNDGDAAHLSALFRAFVHQHVRKSYDGVHRRADFMAHVRQELALCPVGGVGVLFGFRQLLLGVLTLGNVPNIALNDVSLAFPVNIADKFDGDVLATFVFERKILVANRAKFLQRGHRALGAFSILEDADLPQLLSHKIFAGKAKQLSHEAIDIKHLGRLGIKDKDAVVRRLEQPPVADFRNLHFMFSLPPIANVMKNQHDPANVPSGIKDWSGAVINRPFAAIPCDEDRMVRQTDDRPLANRSCDGILHRLRGLLVHDIKDVG